jgi:hypothetical protein
MIRLGVKKIRHGAVHRSSPRYITVDDTSKTVTA